jgi:hypothetical protein
MGVQASSGEKHEGRAAAFSGANSWSMVCLQQAAILQQQHKQQKQKLLESLKGVEGSPRNTPEKRKFCKFVKDLAKAKCSQIYHSKYLGTSHKVGLAILESQNGV